MNRFVRLQGRLTAGALLLLGVLVITAACTVSQQPPNVEATVAAAVAATQQSLNLPATVQAAVAATVQAGPAAVLPQITPIPVEATPLPLPSVPAAAADIEQVRTVIQTEVNAAVARDLPLLESLYAPDAVVIDRSGTPGDPADDNVWRGWVNIQRRYEAFFSSGVSSIALVDLSIQVNGDDARGVHRGAFLDGVFSPDIGIYTLRRQDGQWFITQLEYGNAPSDSTAANPPPAAPPTRAAPATNTNLYELRVGSQHRYEEPWGWDRGDPCTAWETGNFDDTKPNYRGFNVELLLTNHSDEKVPDEWPIGFSTARGQAVKACFYGYPGAGPQSGATNSVTFFTVVEQGDFVDTITFNLNGNVVQLCLDGQGGWWEC